MNDECCMFACHQPVAEVQAVDTVIDGVTVPITYRLCQGCADVSRGTKVEIA